MSYATEAFVSAGLGASAGPSAAFFLVTFFLIFLAFSGPEAVNSSSLHYLPHRVGQGRRSKRGSAGSNPAVEVADISLCSFFL